MEYMNSNMTFNVNKLKAINKTFRHTRKEKYAKEILIKSQFILFVVQYFVTNYRRLEKSELFLSGNENTIIEIMSCRKVMTIQFPYILGYNILCESIATATALFPQFMSHIHL